MTIDKKRHAVGVNGTGAYYVYNSSGNDIEADRKYFHELFENLENIKNVKGGSSTFAGNSSSRSIAHGLGVTPSAVTVTPSSNTAGYVGEIWVIKNDTYIYVYNSGSSTASFDWIAIE